jgi:hypothetical protein
MQPSSVSRSSAGSSSPASQRLPASPNRSHLRARDQPAHQDGVDLVLRPRARAHEHASARKAPAHRARALVWHPERVERAGGEQLRERPGIEAVCLRARRADAGVARADDEHLADVGLEDARNLPRASRHLERHAICGREALREELECLGRRLDPPRRGDPGLLDDRDLAEVAVDVQPDRSHQFPPLAC